MAFAKPDRFDHDRDGKPGGSLPKGVSMAKKTGDDTISGPADADNLEPLADAPELDPSDPAVTGIPRDEREDSIDPATGLLTEEAQRLRAERLAREREAQK